MTFDAGFAVLSLVLLAVGVVGAVLILRTARATMRESVEGVPPRLPGIWPAFAERRYARLSHDEKKAWWIHLRYVQSTLINPLTLGIVVTFFLFRNLLAFIALGALLAAAMIYSLHGGKLPRDGSE